MLNARYTVREPRAQKRVEKKDVWKGEGAEENGNERHKLRKGGSEASTRRNDTDVLCVCARMYMHIIHERARVHARNALHNVFMPALSLPALVAFVLYFKVITVVVVVVVCASKPSVNTRVGYLEFYVAQCCLLLCRNLY